MGRVCGNREELTDIKLTGHYNLVKVSNEVERAGKNGSWMSHTDNLEGY